MQTTNLAICYSSLGPVSLNIELNDTRLKVTPSTYDATVGVMIFMRKIWP